MSVLILKNTPQATFIQVKNYIHKRMTYGWHICHNLTSKDIDDVIIIQHIHGCECKQTVCLERLKRKLHSALKI